MVHSYGLVPHLNKKLSELLYKKGTGASGGLMDSEFKSHWVLHAYDLVPYLSKKAK